MSVADAPGNVVALKIPSAASDASRPKFAVGTSVWFCSHTLASTNDPPKLRLWLPFAQVAAFSMTLVDASRDDCVELRPGFVNWNPVPQQAELKFRR